MLYGKYIFHLIKLFIPKFDSMLFTLTLLQGVEVEVIFSCNYNFQCAVQPHYRLSCGSQMSVQAILST